MITPNSTRKEIFLKALQTGAEAEESLEALLSQLESLLKLRDRNDEVPIEWYIGYVVGAAVCQLPVHALLKEGIATAAPTT